ncbi:MULTISPECIES: septum site-determining protein Ssd [unclassified Streptomyces]|uniref:septum site-determining protein Ssd n=1 Tax=unclassified Streptomyces TaxID=2593676 RepID=UPI0033AAAD6A
MAGSLTREGLTVAEGRRGGPLIVTEDMELLDDLLRLCAAAGAEPEVHHEPPGRRGGWERAPMVLVGDDAAARCRGAARRRGVMLVGRDQDDPDVWRRAVEIGAEYVLRLPDSEGWLVDQIANAAEGVGRPALTVGVMGGRGGSGASTLACALAVSAARSGRRTMLIDADPLGGGIDVLLGGERAEGMRWPDFAHSKGRLGGGALEDSLPALHGLRVLSWGRDDEVAIAPQAVQAVLAAARRLGGVVVVDLPRRVDEAVTEALAQLDLGLLVVPGELRAVAAAKRVASTVRMVLDDIRVVARGPYAAGLDGRWVAQAIGLPLVGELPPESGLLAAQDAGMPPGADARGPLARFCAEFWEQAAAVAGEPGSAGAPAGGGAP